MMPVPRITVFCADIINVVAGRNRVGVGDSCGVSFGSGCRMCGVLWSVRHKVYRRCNAIDEDGSKDANGRKMCWREI